MSKQIIVGSRTVNELRARFVGKYVITRRELSHSEYVKMAGSIGWHTPWYPGFGISSAGVIIDFVENDKKIFARDDEGWEWRIWPVSMIEWGF